jgi:predicted transcriptional regulator
MTQANSLRKNKVILADYPYRRDIENRVLMAHLSVFEVNVLREILHHSLKISVEHLAEALDTSVQTLLPVLDKLSATKLFKRTNMTLMVDKEARKYFESQIEKFSEDFKPDMEFLQSLLNKIPIHVLPNWYAIPRSSDNIFDSIVEKYFLTPKIYRQYLEELQFDDPIIAKIIYDLYQASNFRLSSSAVIKKYKLTREQFEEYLLLLEYSFVCCLRYSQVNDQWEEVITPFHEWLEYLQIEAHSKPGSIKEKDQIKMLSALEFSFIKDMQTILKSGARKKLGIKNIESLFSKKEKTKEYLDNLLDKLAQLEFISMDQTTIQVLDKGALWLAKTISDQALSLANNPLNKLKDIPSNSSLYQAKNIRQVEKSLKKLVELEWVYLEDFVKGMIYPLTHQDPVTLINKGKKWKYSVPIYKEEDYQFIRAVIMERLFELGIVLIGTLNGKPCFCLTPFGRVAIS